MLLFDAFHDEYRGVICLVQLVVRMHSSQCEQYKEIYGHQDECVNWHADLLHQTHAAPFHP